MKTNYSGLYKLNVIMSVVGIALASYIIYVQVAKPDTTICYVNAIINCNAVFFGESSMVLGIPTPLYGMAGFIMILFSNIFKKPVVSFGAATFGFLFCLRLILIEIFQLGEYCPICMLCQTLMISVMISSFLLMRNAKKSNSSESPLLQ